ncbi:MAG: TnsA endonuclease N-terminal domain-containing protein [Methylophilus sp.]|nr:TnsA endonuclease N-terminal domain-containing protein [Methylophilus sp.]
MRKTRRFTTQVLARFIKLKRGTGVFEEYVPWHRVSRSDPSSIGRSHLRYFKNRHVELLSDNEDFAFLFCTMLPDLFDIREQFPLSLDEAAHELFNYDIDFNSIHSGTREVANSLNVKHPAINGEVKAFWIMTTDLLVTLKKDNTLTLLAISVKQSLKSLTKREKELLLIESEYWKQRGVDWLLITKDEYHPRVGETLRRAASWKFSESSQTQEINKTIAIVKDLYGLPLISILHKLAVYFNSMDIAQRAFWQAVWLGKIPIDLNRGWRPHIPVYRIPECEFWQQNPIAVRRSACL